MQNSMYTAMFGALTQEHRMDIIANNLANVNTTGYKQDRTAFKDVFMRYAHDNIREPMMHMRSKAMFPEPDYYAKPRIAEAQIDFSQGSLKQTGNPLDLAIGGEGFFKVQTQEGKQYLTRDGSFHMRNDGTVVNANGDELLGDGGPVVLPPNEQVVINGGGQIFAGGELVDTVTVVTVDRPEGLQKVGHNYFEPRSEGAVQEQPVQEASVEQGYLEAPNVQIVTEMVNMIETQRAFEAYQKVIQNTNETDMKAVNKVGTPG